MTELDKREKELKRLIYVKSQILKQTRKEIKQCSREIDEINKVKSKKR